jgi:hypothetical protein
MESKHQVQETTRDAEERRRQKKLRRMTFIVKAVSDDEEEDEEEETDGDESSTTEDEEENDSEGRGRSGSCIVRDDIDSDGEERRRAPSQRTQGELRAGSTPELDVELRPHSGDSDSESESEAKKSESDDVTESESDGSAVYYLSEDEDEDDEDKDGSEDGEGEDEGREGSTIINEDGEFVSFVPRTAGERAAGRVVEGEEEEGDDEDEEEDEDEGTGSVIIRDDSYDSLKRTTTKEPMNEVARDASEQQPHQQQQTDVWAQKAARKLNKQVWLKEQRKKRTVKSVLFEEEDFLWRTLNAFTEEKHEHDTRRRERRDKRKGAVWASAPIPTRIPPTSSPLSLLHLSESSTPTLIRHSSSSSSSASSSLSWPCLDDPASIYEPLLIVEFPEHVRPGHKRAATIRTDVTGGDERPTLTPHAATNSTTTTAVTSPTTMSPQSSMSPRPSADGSLSPPLLKIPFFPFSGNFGNQNQY